MQEILLTEKSEFKTLNLTKTEKNNNTKKSSVMMNFKNISLNVLKEMGVNNQKVSVASLFMVDVVCIAELNNIRSSLRLGIGDLQLDNKLHSQGCFDFPVVIIAQKPYQRRTPEIYFSHSLKKDIESVMENAFLILDLTWEEDNICGRGMQTLTNCT